MDNEDFPIHTSGFERIMIKAGGDVGIGTSSPAEKFDVFGNINVSGDYRIGGVSILKNTGTGNMFVGEGAGENNTGVEGTFFGAGAGTNNNSGDYNSFFGYSSGSVNTSGSANSFFGNISGANNTTGAWNTFIGAAAGLSNTTGSDNVFMGISSGTTNQTGYQNTFVGGYAGNLNFDGDCNSFFGYHSGLKNSSGRVNAFFGYLSGLENTTGSFNAFLGSGAGSFNTTGYENTFVGQQAGESNTTGHNNTFLGAYATPGSSNLINATAIGAYATATENNTLILGSINGLNGATASVNVGIGTTTPANKLEIDQGTADNSGLRFTQLTSSSSTQAANGKVLSVNPDGDVILVDNPGGGDVLACTTSTANFLTKWISGTNTICESIIYDDGQRAGVNVIPSIATLESKNELDLAAVYGISEANNNQSAIYGVVGESRGALDVNLSIAGFAEESTSATNLAVAGQASGSESENKGVSGIAEHSSTTAVNVGVQGRAAESSHENMGGRFSAYGTTGVNYGIFAEAAYGPFGAPNHYAGYFDGDVHVTGGLTWVSDRKFKDNITNIDPNTALQRLLQLEPKSYHYMTSAFPSINLPVGNNHFGLIAQDVENVFPELVKDIIHPEQRDNDGNTLVPQVHYKGVDYSGFIPLLISSVIRQQRVIDSLSSSVNQRLTSLEQGMMDCCGANQRKTNSTSENETFINQIAVDLNPLQVVLEQNVPNPFAEQTTISYYIPNEVNSSRIIFYDAIGRIVKEVDVENGYGIVTVFASNLSAGTYSYTLLIDGEAIETKKMLKSN
ncbi:MAG: tail fiber domain-containing protein [Chitinophagales bacterium]